MVEVEALRHHLRADEHIGLALGKVVDDALVGVLRACRVEVHPRDLRLRHEGLQLVLDALRAEAAAADVVALAVGTDGGHAQDVAAIVAGEQAHGLVVGQRDVAMGTLGGPAADMTLHPRGEAASILKQDGLLTTGQGGADGGQ